MGKEINEIDNYYTKELALYNTIFNDARLFLRTLIIWHKHFSKEKFSTLPRRKELGYFTSGTHTLDTDISEAFNELTTEFKEFYKVYSNIMNTHLIEIHSLVSNNENILNEYFKNLRIKESQVGKEHPNPNRIKSLDSIYSAIKLYETTFKKYDKIIGISKISIDSATRISESKKLIWNGNAASLAFFIDLLIVKGYINPMGSNNELAETLKNCFEFNKKAIKGNSLRNLVKRPRKNEELTTEVRYINPTLIEKILVSIPENRDL
jgi:hypothetical protein